MGEHTLKQYSNGEITVNWKPALCSHSGKCFRGLPEVFDPRKRPWIFIQGATSDQIIEQVKKCPSGALSTIKNSEIQNNEQ
jgi:uncharacterized Fe-S cluster protein YjdI